MNLDDKHIYVKGGNRLCGEISINGSKNSSLACIVAACIVTDGSTVTLNNVPDIIDVRVLINIIELMGKKVVYNNNTISISGPIIHTDLPLDLTGAIRGSFYCLGLSICTKGKVSIGLPGGDRIGDRPVDIHLEALELMGVKSVLNGGRIESYVPDKLIGNKIYLRFPSVGATCNIMIAAAKAEGKTIIQNAAKEPEIVDLANLLNQMGVKVSGAGTDTITIYNSENLHGDVTHDIIPDRIEAGVLIAATTITGGDVLIKNSIPHHNYPIISVLRNAGVKITIDDTDIRVISEGSINSIKVTTMPFPGMATDLQPLLTVIALLSDGESTITDMVFPDRFSYVCELCRMGAQIYHSGNTAKVKGKSELEGIKVDGNDIRSVTTLICAGLIADGITEITGYSHLRRGYKDLCVKLNNLGADITIK